MHCVFLHKKHKMQNKLNLLYRFFCWCSGARLYLLKECPTDYNKFFGIGIVIFLTGLMASLSGGYAFYTIFQNIVLAILFGVFWGVLIFFLDWYLVSSLKKQNNSRKELAMAFPRIILAIFLGVVISKPLELKLFEKEINKQLESSKHELSINYKDLVDEEFKEITNLEESNTSMNSQIQTKEKERDNLFNMTIAEAEGRSVTGRAGKGPVYDEKKAALKKIDKELETLKNRYLPLIDKNQQRIDALVAKRDSKLIRSNDVNEKSDGFLARLVAFGKLSNENTTIAIVGWFIVLLFISIESAPIFVKLISDRGAYDELLEAVEFEKKFAVRESINKVKEKATILAYQKEEQRLKYEVALDNTRNSMDKILHAKKEIEDKKVDKWKQSEINKIEKDMNSYAKFIENIFEGKFAKLEDKDKINKDLNIN